MTGLEEALQLLNDFGLVLMGLVGAMMVLLTLGD
tara:strand:- start:191 stop:292 length:102 start_codon:yes stop_codon:yes gene_type:complete